MGQREGPLRVSVAEVRGSLRTDINMLPPEKWFGRPLSALVTPFFYASGISANQMTVVRTAISAAGLAALAVPQPLWWSVAAITFYATYVLDYVDGNLARLRGTVSYLGKYIDGLSDGLFHHLASLMAGIGGWLYFDEPRLLVLGAVITAMSLFADMIRARMSFMREWMVRLTGPLTETENAAANSARSIQGGMVVVAATGSFLMVAALFYPPWGIVIFLLLASVFQLLKDLVTIYLTICEANVILRRPRRSAHAASTTDGGC